MTKYRGTIIVDYDDVPDMKTAAKIEERLKQAAAEIEQIHAGAARWSGAKLTERRGPPGIPDFDKSKVKIRVEP